MDERNEPLHQSDLVTGSPPPPSTVSEPTSRPDWRRSILLTSHSASNPDTTPSASSRTSIQDDAVSSGSVCAELTWLITTRPTSPEKSQTPHHTPISAGARFSIPPNKGLSG